MAFFIGRKKNPKIFVEPQKTLNIQSNLDKEGQRWSYHMSWFETIFKLYKQNIYIYIYTHKNYSNQNSMILVKNRRIDQ